MDIINLIRSTFESLIVTANLSVDDWSQITTKNGDVRISEKWGGLMDRLEVEIKNLQVCNKGLVMLI